MKTYEPTMTFWEIEMNRPFSASAFGGPIEADSIDHVYVRIDDSRLIRLGSNTDANEQGGLMRPYKYMNAHQYGLSNERIFFYV